VGITIAVWKPQRVSPVMLQMALWRSRPVMVVESGQAATQDKLFAACGDEPFLRL
jgi:hypothetical protein